MGSAHRCLVINNKLNLSKSQIMKKYLLLIAFVCTLLIGCKPDPELPTVDTFQVQ